MVTGVEIAFGFKALKSALDVVKDIKGLTDTTAINAKVIELQSLIMEAQAGAIDAREDHAAQVERIRALEKEIADLKAWGAERENYELKTVDDGVVAYMLKKAVRGTEPPHWLCATCYGNGKKGFLQRQPRAVKDTHGRYQCGTCGNTVGTHWASDPRWID